MQIEINSKKKPFAMVNKNESAEDRIFVALNMLRTVKMALRSSDFDGTKGVIVADAVNEICEILSSASNSLETFNSDRSAESVGDRTDIDRLYKKFKSALDGWKATAADEEDLSCSVPEFEVVDRASRTFFCYPCRTLTGFRLKAHLIQTDEFLLDDLCNTTDGKMVSLFLASMTDGGDIRQ